MSRRTPGSRAARCSLALLAVAGLVAACGDSGGGGSAITVTAGTTTAVQTVTDGGVPAAAPTGEALGQLATEIGAAIDTFHVRFASSARQGTLAQKQAVLDRLADGFGNADKTVADAEASSPLGGVASGLTALHRVTQPLAAYLAKASQADTPASVAKVWCDVRALDRLHRTTVTAERAVNEQASALGVASAPFTTDKPTRGAWNVVVASGCVGALRDQFSALRTAASKKQAKRAAGTADAIRAAMLGVMRGMGPGLAEDNPVAVRRAAEALRDLARLEAQYMALVANSWRGRTISAAARKQYEAEIPNAFKRAADRVKRSGVLELQ